MNNYGGYESALAQAGGLSKSDYVELRNKVRKGRYQEALQELAKKNGNELTPKNVVDAARSKESVLHKAFEWDDKVAGDKYRLMQARVLINNVRVVIEGEKKQAFFNARVEIKGKAVQKYFPVERVKDDESIRLAILKDLVREIRHLQDKYKSVSQLNGLINEAKLKEIESELEE